MRPSRKRIEQTLRPFPIHPIDNNLNVVSQYRVHGLYLYNLLWMSQLVIARDLGAGFATFDVRLDSIGGCFSSSRREAYL